MGLSHPLKNLCTSACTESQACFGTGAPSASSDFEKYRARKKKFEHEGRPFIDVHLAARKRMYVWHHDMTCGIMVQSSAAFGVMRRALRAITELEARFARIHRVRRLRCYVVSTLFAHSTRGLYLQIVPPLIDILDENRKQVPAYDGWIGSTRAFSEHATIGISDTMKKTAGVSTFRSRNDAHPSSVLVLSSIF